MTHGEWVSWKNGTLPVLVWRLVTRQYVCLEFGTRSSTNKSCKTTDSFFIVFCSLIYYVVWARMSFLARHFSKEFLSKDSRLESVGWVTNPKHTYPFIHQQGGCCKGRPSGNTHFRGFFFKYNWEFSFERPVFPSVGEKIGFRLQHFILKIHICVDARSISVMRCDPGC